MQIRTSRIAGTMLVLAAAFALAATPAFARNGTFRANTTPVQSASAQNRYSGLHVTGTATLTVSGTTLTAHITASGLSPNLPHVMHIHGTVGAQNDCPSPVSAFDTNHDGLLNTAEGLPAYGPIDVTFSTTGDTSPAAALTLTAAPMASASGTINYTRTFQIPGKIAAHLSELHVVIHGADLNRDHAYDGAVGAFPGVPLEAEIPVSCGAIN